MDILQAAVEATSDYLRKNLRLEIVERPYFDKTSVTIKLLLEGQEIDSVEFKVGFP